MVPHGSVKISHKWPSKAAALLSCFSPPPYPAAGSATATDDDPKDYD